MAAKKETATVRAASLSRAKSKGRPLTNIPQVSDLQTPTATLKDLLQGPNGLADQINEIEKLGARMIAMRNTLECSTSTSTPPNPADRKIFNAEVQAIYERYQAIEPKKVDHELRRRFENERDRPFSYWSLLRASCLYWKVCSRARFPIWVWYVAGRELCILKALQTPGEVRLLTAEMYKILKVDTKFTKGLLEGSLARAEDMFYDVFNEPALDDQGDDVDNGS
ncbi:hypothetical protein A1O1_02261 [Capronia coronata CBS 617.96]|uniref:Uncharacterized protein n=1 Tax=Capronia coronata CBS 617.96 TaxID=1182541 RepID=W9YMW8_9EURO|nr:uncharacterized protein A1O1_02261 [Capronia coronata CBS 617.96]EXJ93868.1 hypothetical protein A1O1_02261 [Capronia coronata CBS 617.96]